MKSAATLGGTTEPIVIKHEAGAGIVSDIALDVASSETSSARMAAALLHLGEEDRRDRSAVGGLRPGN